MKALFFYTEDSGHGQLTSHIGTIIESLRKHFGEVDVYRSPSVEAGFIVARDACGRYDVLIVAGGDGTFNNVLNAVVGQASIPTIGYFNNGTLGDIGNNIGIGHHWRKSLRIIKKGYVRPIDVGFANGHYFSYVCAIGRYADISYATPRKNKKYLGRFSYYFSAVGQAFKKKTVFVAGEVDGTPFEARTPFVLLLNGRRVGGFPVNPHGRIDDGDMELFLTKPGLFNGLMNYLFHVKTRKLVGKSFRIHTDQQMPWCFDGEAGPTGDLQVECLHNAIKVFCAKPRRNQK